MPTISVVTAVHPERTQFLLDAYGSLASQELPDGWRWEWHVQQDGPGTTVANLLPPDARITPGRNRHGGPAIARTMALSRATGELVRVLDADDVLPPGALHRDIAAITKHSDVTWTTSRVVDLLPDGSTAGFDFDPPQGLIRRGEVIDHWLSHDYRASVHPATLCMSTPLLLMLGGWMALPASEDTGLLLALNAVSTGYFIAEAGLHYRKWPGQSTAGPDHSDAVERHARMTIIAARARALRQFDPILDAVLDLTDRC